MIKSLFVLLAVFISISAYGNSDVQHLRPVEQLIVSTVSDARVMFKSVRLNKSLAACICGTKSCTANTNKFFSLYSASQNLISGKRAYDTKGRFCDLNCEYEALTSFTCLGRSCGKKKTNLHDTTIRIFYSLRPKSSQEKKTTSVPVLEGIVDVPLSSLRRVAVREDFCF